MTTRSQHNWKTKSGVSMFVDDYILERFWNNPEKYVSMMRACAAVMTPDFSLLLGMPDEMLRWNVYRSRIIGYFWHKNGVRIVPTVSWAGKNSFSFCFGGIKKGSSVCVSNIGVGETGDGAFDAGLLGMIKAIQPSVIYFQCAKGKRGKYSGLENVVFLDSFFDEKRRLWADGQGKR